MPRLCGATPRRLWRSLDVRAWRRQPGTSHLRVSVAPLLLLLVTGMPVVLRAQSVTVSLGERASEAVATGGTVRVPLLVRLDRTGGTRLAAVQGVVRWDTAHLALDSLRSVRRPGVTLVANSESSARGLVRFSAFSPQAFVESGAIFELHYTVKLPRGETSVALELEAIGDEDGRDVRSRVHVRGETLCRTSCRAP